MPHILLPSHNSSELSAAPDMILILTTYLRDLLTPYLNCTPDERDRLIATDGSALMKLESLLYTLTRSGEEREHMIMARQYFLAIERDIEQCRIGK